MILSNCLGLSELSVYCLSVPHALVLYQNEQNSSIVISSLLFFCKDQVHRKIRKGSPGARALNESEIGTNWQFSTFKSPYLRNSFMTKVAI